MTSLSPTIHLIDDDAAVRESLALLIGTVGLRVTTWADPQAFLGGFDREGIGAIVLDVRMPGISGLTLLDTLVAQGVDQPVIMLTGHGTVEMCRRAFKSGAAEFLEKPVNDELLIEAGFTPVEAIQIMTLNGAKILGVDKELGSIAPGKLADLVVIKGDPIARPAEIRQTTIVFKNGVGYDSAKLIASVKGLVGIR